MRKLEQQVSSLVGKQQAASDPLADTVEESELTRILETARISPSLEFRDYLNVVADFAWEFDPSSSRFELSISARDVLEIEPKFFPKTLDEFSSMIHPDDRADHWQSILSLVKSGNERGYSKYRFVGPDFEKTVWIEDHFFCLSGVGSHGSIRLIGSSRRIKEIGQVLRGSCLPDPRFKLLANTAPVMIWLSGTDKLCYWFNLPWLDFVGRTMEQEQGDGWIENVHPEDYQRCLTVYTQSFDERKPFGMEYRLRRHDGQYRWILDNGVPIFDASGNFGGYIGSCVDIQTMKEAERKLIEVDRKKTELLTMLAHELRNPLAPIRNCLEIIRLVKNNADAVERARSMMDRHLGHLVRLLDDLLECAHTGGGLLSLEIQSIDLRDAIHSAVEANRFLIEERHLNLVWIRSPHPIVIQGDFTRLVQVFSNLLSNAVNYSNAEGTIEVITQDSAQDAQVIIKDSGHGIPPEKLNAIFDMFVQLEPLRINRLPGLGIGLYLVKTIVEMHGAQVRAHSEGLGKGSQFSVHFSKTRH